VEETGSRPYPMEDFGNSSVELSDSWFSLGPIIFKNMEFYAFT
jgi:hypothetical protein